MAILVPAVLGGLALAVMTIVSIAAARKGKHPAAQNRPDPGQPRILVHSINDDRCVGCDACVAVCPTNVLDLISNKSRVVHFEDCIQCEACMWACPTEALVMHLEGTDPPPLKVPDIDENFETAVPGQYLIGEVAGKPLVKNAANLGRYVVEHMLGHGLRKGALPAGDPSTAAVDVAVVGSGPGGLSAALACIQRGLSYAVLEKEQVIASTVARYPKGKLFMAEPYEVDNVSFLPVFDSSKEEIVPIWEDVVSKLGIDVKLGEAVEGVTRGKDGVFDIRTTVARYRAQRVVLATGTRGKPRTLGVPGENLRKVCSLLEDPDEHGGKNVLVVGGGDSALEAAIALADSGAQVLMSYRGRAFSRAAPKNRATIDSYSAQRRIAVLFQSNVAKFTDASVVIKLQDGSEKEFPNEAAFVLIGADPPIKWLEKVGVKFVEKPHEFQLGKSDEKLRGVLSDLLVCPESAAGAVSLVRGEELPPEAMARPSLQLDQTVAELTGARKWLKSATAIFTSQREIDKPMTLSEFANRPSSPGRMTQTIRRHTGHGRRDLLNPAERTRVLRMLRDVGGRMADEDSQVFPAGGGPTVRGGSPAPAPLDERMRAAGLRGPTYLNIPVPTLPNMAAAGAAHAGPGAGQHAGPGTGQQSDPPRQAVIVGLSRAGAEGPSRPRDGGDFPGVKLEAASQLRNQKRGLPVDASKTIVQMELPKELRKHIAERYRQSHQNIPNPFADMSDEKTQMATFDPKSFMRRIANEEPTEFSPPSSRRDGGDKNRHAAQAETILAAREGNARPTVRDLPQGGAPADPHSAPTRFNMEAVRTTSDAHDRPTMFNVNAAPPPPGAVPPPAPGQGQSQGSAQTLYMYGGAAKSDRSAGGGGATSRPRRGSSAPPNAPASRRRRSSSSAPAATPGANRILPSDPGRTMYDPNPSGARPAGGAAGSPAGSRRPSGGTGTPSLPAARRLDFSDEATRAADVAEIERALQRPGKGGDEPESPEGPGRSTLNDVDWDLD